MCRSLSILARHYRVNLKLRIESPALDSKINFVWHRDRFCFCRKLCQTLYRLFRFFYDRKMRAFATRIFVCRAAIHYQSDFNFDAALNTTLPFYTNTAFMPTLHINAAHISIPHTYQYRKHITILQSIINPITRYRSYTKSHFTQHHFHVGFTPHRQHSSVAPLPQYCLFRHCSTCGSTQQNYSKS